MRKQMVLAAAVLVTPVLMAFGQPGKDRQPGKPGGAPAGQPQATPAKPAGKADDELKATEEKIWGTVKNKDWTAFSGMLADEFMMPTGDGIHNKAETLELVKKESLTAYTLSDWHVVHMGENGAIVMYKADQTWTGADGKANSGTSWCSSTWNRHGGKWVAMAHQETEARGAAK